MIPYAKRAHGNAYALLIKTSIAAYQYCVKQYDAAHAARYKLHNAVLPNSAKKSITAIAL